MRLRLRLGMAFPEDFGPPKAFGQMHFQSLLKSLARGGFVGVLGLNISEMLIHFFLLILLSLKNFEILKMPSPSTISLDVASDTKSTAGEPLAGDSRQALAKGLSCFFFFHILKVLL